MEKNISIRKAEQADFAGIYELIKTAFLTAEHADGDEQDFAVGLRNGQNYIPSLELVAQDGGRLVGHIMLTRAAVVRTDGSRYEALLVAPLSVALEYRNLGVGSALMEEGLRIAASMGYGAAFLLGDPLYYGRFGYKAAHLSGVFHEEFPQEYLLAKEIVPGALEGAAGRLAL